MLLVKTKIGDKYEIRMEKSEKKLYMPNETPILITVPKSKFFTITGKGNPNKEDFKKRVEVLYSLSYEIRMMPKNGFTPNGYFEYTLYPLEGIWDVSDNSKKAGIFDKEELVYKIMIRQPDFVNDELVKLAFEKTKLKKITL